jgi:hypothetical protein
MPIPVDVHKHRIQHLNVLTQHSSHLLPLELGLGLERVWLEEQQVGPRLFPGSLHCSNNSTVFRKQQNDHKIDSETI